MILDCKTTQLAIDHVHSMSVWQNRGGSWVAASHSETPAAPKR
jgi:hypothetical protein